MRIASLPLERKLPLLITGLLAAVLAVALISTWRMLRESAEVAASERLERAAQGIAISAEAALQARSQTLRALATDTALIAGVRRGDTTAIASLLKRVAPPRDSHAVEFLDAAGRRVAGVGIPVSATERALAFAWTRERSLARLRRDTAYYSPLYSWNGNTRFWGVVPVTAGGRRIGYVAHQRRTGGGPGGTASLGGLLGEETGVHIRNADGRYWMRVAGTMGGPPARRDSTPRSIQDRMADDDVLVAAEAPVRGTPWFVVAQAPFGAVLAPARATLLRLLALSAGLVLVGALVAWAMSRSIVRPLASLTTAAESISHGDYRRRVGVAGNDEIGRLGQAFDEMAEEVARSRDALERRTLESEMARQDAERANRAKADFLAVMSHELRTPLNAIGGYADLLNLGIYGALNDEQRDALTRIARNQEHLLALINDILNFAKIDAGQVQFDIQDIPLQEVLIGIEPLIAPQLRAKQLEFIVELGDPQLTARADGEKVRQILINLLTNAIKFTPAGGRISVECTSEHDQAIIRVADTGPGIPRDRLATIFDPFVQADRALNRPHDGVGLGLAISRDLARAMGGGLTAESEVGRGAVFSVALPRGQSPQLTPPRSKSAAGA